MFQLSGEEFRCFEITNCDLKQHDTFSRNTRAQLKQVFDAMRAMMTPPDPPKRPIGFVMPEDKDKKPRSAARRRT
jgi:hypothetical protein